MICMMQTYPIHIIMMNPIMLPHHFQILVIKMIGKLEFVILWFFFMVRHFYFFNDVIKKVPNILICLQSVIIKKSFGKKLSKFKGA